MVPPWLTGTWERTYIRRKSKDDAHFGKPDSSISVRYIQTPWAFIDIRSRSTTSSLDEEEGSERPMAFAGVTTVSESDEDIVNGINNGLVRWHACIDMDEPNMDSFERWREAGKGTPRATQDVGYFKNVSKEVNIKDCYHETDPDNTYLEQWVKIDDAGGWYGDDGCFLAARDIRGKILLVVAGTYFGYVNQEDNVYVSGRIKDRRMDLQSNWIIETSANDDTLVGTVPDIKGSFQGMRGSTLAIENIWDTWPPFGRDEED